MQHFKSHYLNDDYKNTFSNIQKCLRLNDLHEVGDGTHYLTFQMIGFFSFQEWSLQQSIDFMWIFMSKLNIKPDYVTIHPDKMEEWKSLYSSYDVEIRIDDECVWSDGNISGYCTEFYKNNIEIGNIVNTLGRSIDIGFGLERLMTVLGLDESLSRLNILEQCVLDLINSSVVIGHNKQGYILKKLIIDCILSGSVIEHNFFIQVKNNMRLSYLNYLKNKSKKKYSNKDNFFWKDTFGIDVEKIDIYEGLIQE